MQIKIACYSSEVLSIATCPINMVYQVSTITWPNSFLKISVCVDKTIINRDITVIFGHKMWPMYSQMMNTISPTCGNILRSSRNLRCIAYLQYFDEQWHDLKFMYLLTLYSLLISHMVKILLHTPSAIMFCQVYEPSSHVLQLLKLRANNKH